MPLCNACESIVPGRRNEDGHDALKETAQRKYNQGFGSVYTTSYTCRDCGAKWEYEDDKNDDGAGWTLVSAG